MAESPQPPRPLLVTADATLLDDVLRLAAAADVELEVAHAAGPAPSSWATAPLVLVGADLAGDLVRGDPPRRRGVLLLNSGSEEDAGPEVWRQAVEIGAEQVVPLAQSEGWLANRLADALDGDVPPAPTVCVVGGSGGAGASVLATALALTGARLGYRPLLVDADPLGGGIDLVAGSEQVAGSRWTELAGARGRVSATSLRGALPTLDGLTVLSWDRDGEFGVPADVMGAVLAAARRGTDLVVIDLPRNFDDAARVALACGDVTLLVVPAEVRASVAAARVVKAAREYTTDLRLVVRGPAPTGLPADTIAGSLGLPLAGRLRAEPDLAAALDRAEPPTCRGRGPLTGFCTSFLTTLTGERRVAA